MAKLLALMCFSINIQIWLINLSIDPCNISKSLKDSKGSETIFFPSLLKGFTVFTFIYTHIACISSIISAFDSAHSIMEGILSNLLNICLEINWLKQIISQAIL